MELASLKPLLSLVRITLAATALVMFGCSASEEAPPPGWDGTSSENGGASGGEVPGTPCEDGVEKDCSITVEQANGVKSCWQGKQTCENGIWQRCLETEDEATP